jgi:hypothetical protein
MYRTATTQNESYLAPSTLEEMAWQDAATDRQLREPFWYPVFEHWAQSGSIGEDEWRRYREAYAAAAQCAPAAMGRSGE